MSGKILVLLTCAAILVGVPISLYFIYRPASTMTAARAEHLFATFKFGQSLADVEGWLKATGLPHRSFERRDDKAFYCVYRRDGHRWTVPLDAGSIREATGRNPEEVGAIVLVEYPNSGAAPVTIYMFFDGETRYLKHWIL